MQQHLALDAFLATLTPAQKAELRVAAMDMHRPFLNAIKADPALAHVAVVNDPFHIMKRAGEAMSELRRQIFFRGGDTMRLVGRGTRWLVLRAWKHASEKDRAELHALFQCNGRLARAYQTIETLRAAITGAPDGTSMAQGLRHVLRRTAKHANVPVRKLRGSLIAHWDQIIARGEHRPPTGRIEALNNNWETMVGRSRGHRGLNYLLQSSCRIMPVGLGTTGDFEDGTFSYDSGTDRFHFVTPWSQTDATQNPQVHYNVVEIQPPPPRLRYYIDASFTSAGGQVYFAKVRVPSPSRIDFAGKNANGTWSQLQGHQCVDDDDTTAPDADGPAGANAFTRTCLLRAPGVVKLAVLTRDATVPNNVNLPSFGVSGIREVFSTIDECGLPTVGADTHCFNDGTPPACALLRSTCATDGDCCVRLTCQSGTCAAPLRGACRTNTDCCAALLFTSGLCG